MHDEDFQAHKLSVMTGLTWFVDEVGLAAQKSGGLQHIDHGGHRSDVGLVVHIGQDGQAEFFFHFGQNFQTLLHARAAKAGAAGAVGFVVAAFENKRDAQGSGDFFQAAGGVHLQLL